MQNLLPVSDAMQSIINNEEKKSYIANNVVALCRKMVLREVNRERICVLVMGLENRPRYAHY